MSNQDGSILAPSSAVRVLFDELVSTEHLRAGVAFYQFVSAVFTFASSDHNFSKFFTNLSTSERQAQLREVLLLGNKEFFSDSQNNKEWIGTIFNNATSVGAISAIVLQFMILIQEESRGQAHISGDRKLAFVRNSVTSLLRFTPLTESDQAMALTGLDITIQSLILVKNGALKHAVTQVEVVAKNLGCC